MKNSKIIEEIDNLISDISPEKDQFGYDSGIIVYLQGQYPSYEKISTISETAHYIINKLEDLKSYISNN